MKNIRQRLQQVLDSIRAAESEFGRSPGCVELLAVSKTRSPEEVRAAFAAGQHAFGENYVQEAVTKMDALADLPLHWHFIGPLQSNKARVAAERFDWVHSVDRLKVARRLNDLRPADLAPLNVCLQINVSDEASKSGIAPDAAVELASAVAALPRLRLRGLMTMPALEHDFERQRAQFRVLSRCLEQLRQDGFAVDTLSMGTTGDLRAAIAEGATLVRVGTGVFGPRPG